MEMAPFDDWKRNQRDLDFATADAAAVSTSMPFHQREIDVSPTRQHVHPAAERVHWKENRPRMRAAYSLCPACRNVSATFPKIRKAETACL